MTLYRQFVDYLEPGQVKDKLMLAIKNMEREQAMLKRPIDKLRRDRDYVKDMLEREKEKADTLDERNRKLREELNMPETQKQSASEAVNEMRQKLREMRHKMVEFERNTIDIGRNPGLAMEKISNPIYKELIEVADDNQQPVLN